MKALLSSLPCHWLISKIGLFLSFFVLTLGFTNAQDNNLIYPPCISIMGDSLAYGTQVVELPGTGFAEIRTTPFSHILDDILQEKGYLQIGIYDLSLRAAALVEPESNPYLESAQYQLGQNLSCEFVIIFPWLNDLAFASQNLDYSAYATATIELASTITSKQPNSQIILLGYYDAEIMPVGEQTYGTNISPDIVRNMNIVHETICDSFSRIYCYELTTILNPIEDYLSRSIPHAEFEQYNYLALSPEEQINLDNYFRRFPNGSANADGLHFNHLGKERLAQELIAIIESINPQFFQLFPEQTPEA